MMTIGKTQGLEDDEDVAEMGGGECHAPVKMRSRRSRKRNRDDGDVQKIPEACGSFHNLKEISRTLRKVMEIYGALWSILDT